jgi:hypothetical protein
MKKIVIVFLLLETAGRVCEARAADFSMGKCLDIIRMAESSGNRFSVGDNGKSLGAYQIKELTWKKYSRLDWHLFASDPKESRIVAACIVSDIIRHCKKYHARDFAEHPYRAICAHYNAGINTRLTPAQWHRRVKNRVYKAL